MAAKKWKKIPRYGRTIHVVYTSGGRDSQACLKLIKQRHPTDLVIGAFADTGFEHPKTYQHIANMATMYGVDIITSRKEDNTGRHITVLDLVNKYKRFPSGKNRFCTDILKIQVNTLLVRDLAECGYKVIAHIGIRSDESSDRAKRYAGLDDSLYPPHEVMPSKCPQLMHKLLDINFCLPIISWDVDDVMTFLEGEHNELYDAGHHHVGCYPCLMAGDEYKHQCFNADDFGQEQYRLTKAVEKSAVLPAGAKPLFNTNVGKLLEKSTWGVSTPKWYKKSVDEAEDYASPCSMCTI